MVPVSNSSFDVISQANEAEAAGFDTLFLVDHLYQWPLLGATEDPEC